MLYSNIIECFEPPVQDVQDVQDVQEELRVIKQKRKRVPQQSKKIRLPRPEQEEPKKIRLPRPEQE